jgi:hypothetical protein
MLQPALAGACLVAVPVLLLGLVAAADHHIVAAQRARLVLEVAAQVAPVLRLLLPLGCCRQILRSVPLGLAVCPVRSAGNHVSFILDGSVTASAGCAATTTFMQGKQYSRAAAEPARRSGCTQWCTLLR